MPRLTEQQACEIAWKAIRGRDDRRRIKNTPTARFVSEEILADAGIAHEPVWLVTYMRRAPAGCEPCDWPVCVEVSDATGACQFAQTL